VPENLVLLHGFGSTHRLWDGVIARLQPERYIPLALDLPGHGTQAGATPPITFDGCVAGLLTRSPRRFALAGYSMGGRVALHVALASPERVSRLVLVSATAGMEDYAERASRREHDRRLADEIEHGPIEDFVERWRRQPMFAHDPPELDARARSEMMPNRPAGIAAALRGIGTGEMRPLWARLRELEMPVTVVVGERDAKFRATAARMAALLPHAQLVVAPGGHVLPLECPQAVADALRSSAAAAKPPA
jgi:2-succinyl-6-hydroxy-2,4-cyclohexadiene-1-carboxylate synthase